jgi:hypothetical protein
MSPPMSSCRAFFSIRISIYSTTLPVTSHPACPFSQIHLQQLTSKATLAVDEPPRVSLTSTVTKWRMGLVGAIHTTFLPSSSVILPSLAVHVYVKSSPSGSSATHTMTAGVSIRTDIKGRSNCSTEGSISIGPTGLAMVTISLVMIGGWLGLSVTVMVADCVVVPP